MGEDKDLVEGTAEPSPEGDAPSTDPSTLAPTLMSDGAETPPTTPQAPEPAPSPAAPLPAGTTDQHGAPDAPYASPGHIPEPKEKTWDSEPADPYEGIDRSDPFEGRPQTATPQPDGGAAEGEEAPAAGQPLPPGYPAGNGGDQDKG